MELALPHVVVRVCGPGIGIDLVAALTLHPIEVAETRDTWEMRRVAVGRPSILVVVVDPPDAQVAVLETWGDFPGVPILIISEAAQPFVPGEPGRGGWVETIRGDRPLQDICWFVLEAVSRAAQMPRLVERPLGPYLISVDDKGSVRADSPLGDAGIPAFFRLRPGDSFLSVVEPRERPLIEAVLGRARAGGAHFCTTRFLDDHGHHHIMSLGIRCQGNDRIALLANPLICGGPIVGRHINNRDPITGLLSRWAFSRAIEAREHLDSPGAEPAVVLVTLNDFEAISHCIGCRQSDEVLLGVASTLNQLFPYPAITGRLMGHTFVAFMSQSAPDEALHRAELLLQALGRVEVPGFTPRFTLRASIGVATMSDGDHDLALRLAEAAASEAQASGGGRVVISRAAKFTGAQVRELTTSMDLGAWEVWLQPVTRNSVARAVYHEALARFDSGRPLASRAEFFIAGRAHGLLERFDRMMLQRAIEILESHPGAKLSVNVSYETFMSKAFPASFLECLRRLPDGFQRIILEIASRCLAGPEQVVRSRLESLAAAGLAVAIDDFGSGICRLRYLTQWPIAIVKLDQLVTGYVDDDPLQRDFVRTVVSLCRARGITTVAEYTRSEEQLARLVEDGVDLFQGELFGMPRPAAEVLAAFSPASAHA